MDYAGVGRQHRQRGMRFCVSATIPPRTSTTHGGYGGGEPGLCAIDKLRLPGGVRRFRRLPVGVSKLPARLIDPRLSGALLGGLSLVAV